MERKSLGAATFFSSMLINMAAIMEKADESLLPAVYKEVGQAFNASPSQLGSLTFVRALVQAISSPLAGILAIKFHRPSVVGLGTVFWGFSTAAVGFSQNFSQCALFRAINGVGLAIVIPALQSFVADSHLEESRGLAFGWLSLVGCIGGVSGSMAATILAAHDFGGFPGWRLAFLLVAIISSLVGWLVHVAVVDPRGPAPSFLAFSRNRGGVTHRKGDNRKSNISQQYWKESYAAIKDVIRVPTFQIIVLQGLVGSLPWTAMVFFTMWFELIGFGHKGAATLHAIFVVGCAFGGLIGGWVADSLALRFPGAGRIMCAQFSSFMGIPFSWLLLTVLPQDPQRWSLFAVILFIMGLTISWCGPSVNSPMFADVVLPKYRTMIYAFDRAFEGAFSAVAAPAVGIVAERIYGYNAREAIPDSGSSEAAYALSRGLFTVMAVPFGLCCLFYTPLYVFYKKDRGNAHFRSSIEWEVLPSRSGME